MKPIYFIKQINLTSVITDEVIEDVPCGTCTRCCEMLSPHLTPDEISSGLYPLSLVQPSPEQLLANPDVGPIVTLFKKRDAGCGMFVDGKCSIYNYRPKACRQFDCRKGHHPALNEFAKDYFKGENENSSVHDIKE